MTFVHFNMPTCEFIEHLRAGAIKAQLAPQVIDQIDTLHGVLDLKEEIATALVEYEAAETARDDLYSELRDLRDAVQAQSDLDPSSMSENLVAALRWAGKVLERHK